MAERESDAPRLVATGPPEFRGMVFPLTRHDTVIGHSESANLVLDDRFVSRLHALITIGESGIAAHPRPEFQRRHAGQRPAGDRATRAAAGRHREFR